MLKKYQIGRGIALLLITVVLALGTGGGQAAVAATDLSPKKTDAEEIIMTYLYNGEIPRDLWEVESALNALTTEKIGVRVKLKPVDLDYQMNGGYYMLLGKREPMDILCFAYEDIGPVIQSGQLLPLNRLIEIDAPGIAQLAEDYPIYSGAVRNREIYGITQAYGIYGYQNSVVIKKNILDVCGLPEKELYDMADLTELLASIKEHYPSCYPLAVTSQDLPADYSLSKDFMVYSTMGGSVLSGVLMGTDSQKIVNLFETEEYYQFLKQMRAWYEAGYLLPDAAVNDSDMTELLKSDTCVCIMSEFWTGNPGTSRNIFGEETAALPVTEGYFDIRNHVDSVYWAVAAASRHPHEAMRLLDLLYSDPEAMNLLAHGVEGKHYVSLEQEAHIRKIIDSGYEGYRFVPNERIRLVLEGTEDWRDWEDWTRKNLENSFVSVGYTFDDSGVVEKLVELREIANRYLPLLETGCCQDWEEMYQEMCAHLKEAGMEDVIARNQAQLDAYLREPLQ